MIVKQVEYSGDIDHDERYNLWDNISKIEKTEYPDENEVTKDKRILICTKTDGKTFEIPLGMYRVFICNDKGKTIETIR